MKLCLVRHAQSTNNALGDSLNGRHHDAPLTDLGLRQAELLAKHLAALPRAETLSTNGYAQSGLWPFTHLYCSPMTRAMQTTRPIAQSLGLTPEIWVDFHEDGGVVLDLDNGGHMAFP